MDNYLKKERELFLQTYNRIPIDILYGEGVHIISRDGTKYLDLLSGLGVNVLGHSHPEVIEAIRKQSERFLHVSNYFVTDIQLEFSGYLLDISKLSRIFLANSGAETVEAAIKIVRKLRGSEKTIYSLSNSFHGRTYGGLSLTNRATYKDDFKPLLQNVGTIKFNNVEDLEKKIDKNTAAIFLEFIQGEGGIHLISDEFVSTLQNLRSKYTFLTIADCIQSGIGRTGKRFAFNHYNFQPDIILTAKSIGGGLPLGAVLVREDYEDVFSFGSHGSTFGGNPLSCAAGLVVLKEIFEKGLVRNVEELGSYLKSQLEQIQKIYPEIIKEVRGSGFMVGVEFNDDCRNIIEGLLKRRIVSSCTAGNVLRLLPPFIITKSDIDFFLFGLHETIKEQM